MTKLFTFLAALLGSQLLSAQSLSPTSGTIITRPVTKQNARLSNSGGELTVKEGLKPAAYKTTPAEEGTMDVYPNPASGKVSFNFALASQSKVQISLSNSFGQKLADVYNADYKNGQVLETIDISQYTAGMYFMNLQYTDASGARHFINKKFQIL